MDRFECEFTCNVEYRYRQSTHRMRQVFWHSLKMRLWFYEFPPIEIGGMIRESVSDDKGFWSIHSRPNLRRLIRIYVEPGRERFMRFWIFWKKKNQ